MVTATSLEDGEVFKGICNLPGGGSTGVLNIQTPGGRVAFDIKIYSGPNGEGRLLSNGVAIGEIQAAKPNVLLLALDGAVSAVRVWPDPPFVVIGKPTKITIYVTALDAAGATIIGKYDQLAKINFEDPSGAIKLLSDTLDSSASGSAIVAQYDGKAIDSVKIKVICGPFHGDHPVIFVPPVKQVSSIGINSAGIVTTTGGRFRLRFTAVDDANQPALTGLATYSFSVVDVLATEANDRSVRVDGYGRVADVTTHAAASAKPSAVGLAIDSSGSMDKNDPSRRRIDASREFVARMNGTTDVALLYKFGPVSLLQDWTADKAALNTAIDQIDESGGTPLYEALYEMLPRVAAMSPADYNRAILVLTDGEGDKNNINMYHVIGSAKSKGIPVYTVGLQASQGSAIEFGVKELREMAVKTGGYFALGSDAASLNNLYSAFGASLKGSIDVDVDLEFPGGLQFGKLYEISARVITRTAGGQRDTRIGTVETIR